MSKRGEATSATAAEGGEEHNHASKRPRAGTSVGSAAEVVMAIEKELKAQPSPERLLQILAEMKQVDVTHELLAQTGVARAIGKLRKSANTEVASEALALVNVWKNIKPAEPKATPKATPTSAAASEESAAASDRKPPKNVGEFRARLVANAAELYKDPPVLPPVSQTVTKPVGSVPSPVFNEGTGCYHFAEKEFRDFTPNLSPEQVLRMGSFGGTYFRSIDSAVTGTRINAAAVVTDTLPPEWVKGVNAGRQLTSASYNNSANKFKVKCGGSLGMWESSGWISDTDPYGWFQWYCFFWRGRRSMDDARQIARGKSVMGPTGRFRVQLFNKIIKANTTYDDATISPVIRQSLQHWGYEVSASDLEAYKEKKGLK